MKLTESSYLLAFCFIIGVDAMLRAESRAPSVAKERFLIELESSNK
jgi:hypothetical protein